MTKLKTLQRRNNSIAAKNAFGIARRAATNAELDAKWPSPTKLLADRLLKAAYHKAAAEYTVAYQTARDAFEASDAAPDNQALLDAYLEAYAKAKTAASFADLAFAALTNT